MKSLWPSWSALRDRIGRAEGLVLFLDYDGTLTPIRAHPSQARLSRRASRLLQALARQAGVWIALVSGRSVKDLRRMVGLKELCYVGNHGLELAGPKLRHVNPAAQKSRPVLAKIGRELKADLRPIRRAWVEDKGFTLAVHYRRVPPTEKLLVRNIFHRIVRPYAERGQVRMTGGKEVLEVRPPVRWTKGTVVNWLLARRRALAQTGEVLPIYAGDDQTDEDALETLKGRGVTIAVGPASRLSLAEYGVASSEDVQRLLALILKLRRKAA